MVFLYFIYFFFCQISSSVCKKIIESISYSFTSKMLILLRITLVGRVQDSVVYFPSILSAVDPVEKSPGRNGLFIITTAIISIISIIFIIIAIIITIIVIIISIIIIITFIIIILTFLFCLY